MTASPSTSVDSPHEVEPASIFVRFNTHGHGSPHPIPMADSLSRAMSETKARGRRRRVDGYAALPAGFVNTKSTTTDSGRSTGPDRKLRLWSDFTCDESHSAEWPDLGDFL